MTLSTVVFDIVAKTMNALTTIENSRTKKLVHSFPYVSFGAFDSAFADMCMYDPDTEVLVLQGELHGITRPPWGADPTESPDRSARSHDMRATAATANDDRFADVGGEAYVNDHYRSAKKNYATGVGTIKQRGMDNCVLIKAEEGRTI